MPDEAAARLRPVDPALWAGRRVLLTGHTGFKGAWLAQWLHALGAEVHGYALAPEHPRDGVYAACGVAGLLASETLADLRDAARVTDTVARVQPQVVLHLAAQALVRRSYAQPLETWSSNVTGTAHVLEAVRSAGREVRAVVVVTTDKCYRDDGLGRALSEDDPLGGHDPYAASKAATELVAGSWRDAYLRAAGVGVATARAGNVIGGGDQAADRLVPDCLRALEAGTPIVIRSPQAVRPWQHVLEPLAGYLRLAERLLAGDASAARAWNFGPPEADAQPVRWIVERLVAQAVPGGAGRAIEVRWGEESRVQLSHGAATGVDRGGAAHTGSLHETATLRLDARAARAQLGWQPRWTLATALDRTLEWHRAWHGSHSDAPAAAAAGAARALPHAAPPAMAALVRAQIDAYCATLPRSLSSPEADLSSTAREAPRAPPA
jgi:CDP-glucose 4,6-dehydratase